MSSKIAGDAPGSSWAAVVRTNGTSEFSKAFVPKPILEASVLNGTCIGIDAISEFFAATAGGMYESLKFTHESNDGAKTYLEWEGKAFGAQVGGTTILTRDETGLIESIRLYHRPLAAFLKFSVELENRLKGKVDPSMLHSASAAAG